MAAAQRARARNEGPRRPEARCLEVASSRMGQRARARACSLLCVLVTSESVFVFDDLCVMCHGVGVGVGVCGCAETIPRSESRSPRPFF